MKHGRFVPAELDAYLAELAEQALAQADSSSSRRAMLQEAIRLTRRMSLTALQFQVAAAVRRGDAPQTLADLKQFVDPRRARWLKPVRQSQRLAAAPKARSNRSSERMFPPEEVARELGVSPHTVIGWCNRALLRSEGLETGQPRVPASALYAYRAGQARWQRLDAVTSAARNGDAEPEEATVFAEIAARRRG